MNRMERSLQLVGRHAGLLKCPHCGNPLGIAGKSAQCERGHTFDFARQGYLNLATRAVDSRYGKELFASRHRTIINAGLFDPLHAGIADFLARRFGNGGVFRIADLGCGEGSHLHRILGLCRQAGTEAAGVGLDLSKAGIQLAARHYPEAIWLVGDLANAPLSDGMFHALLNLLSPANYGEFRRLLVPGGLILKAVPGPDYLRELREALFGTVSSGANRERESAGRAQQPEDSAALFVRHFPRCEAVSFRYAKRLERREMDDLLAMTPLAWNATKEDKEALLARGSVEVTVDLTLLAATV